MTDKPSDPPRVEADGTPVALSLWPYGEAPEAGGKPPFAIEVDARPLHALVEDAGKGLRIYELMSIARPGDIYHYLRVRTVERSEGISARTRHLKPRWVRSRQRHEWGEGWFPFSRFDGLFHWDADDSTPEAECWLRFRSGGYWEETGLRLLAWVRDQQRALRATDDWLSRREIDCFDRGSHRRHFIADIERRCLADAFRVDDFSIPGVVLEAIGGLIGRTDVKSVSAPYPDYGLWRMLCAEQLRRADRDGLRPETAFSLSGPDGGLWHVPYEDWGAEVHIPYEGACMADIFVKPAWRTVFLDADRADGHLTRVFSLCESPVCRYVLTPEDLGELGCAQRTAIGDGWVLYRAKSP